MEEIDVDDDQEITSKWYKYHRKYTVEERRLLIAKAIQAALEVCFGNHIYQCENELYRQVVGGGIGARVTGVVARILMDVWADKLARKLEDNAVVLYMLAKYVDDINLVAQVIPRGFSWQDVGGSLELVWSQETEDLDNQEGKSDTLRTMELIR